MNRVYLTRLVAAVAIAFAVAALTTTNADEIVTITSETLLERLKAKDGQPLLVDVREPEEFDVVHIKEAELLPLAKVQDGLTTVPKDREIVLVCRSGRRSAKAYEILAARGFTNLKNLQGGMIGWEKLGYPVVKK